VANASDAADIRQALDGIEDDWDGLLSEAWADVGQQGGAWLYDDFDDSDLQDALLTAAILKALKDRAKGISDTTRARLINGLDGGQDVQDLYDHWLGDDDSQEESRSDSLAWDLTVGAWAAGLLLAGGQAQQAGHDVTRTWVTVGDGKVREEHAAAEGQTIGVDDAYDVGGESLSYPGDPAGSAALTANCRCGEDYAID
jgi:hypothetical protein